MIVLGECFVKHIQCPAVNARSSGKCPRSPERKGRVLGSTEEALGKMQGLLGSAAVVIGYIHSVAVIYRIYYVYMLYIL